jgi:hypothetical protein
MTGFYLFGLNFSQRSIHSFLTHWFFPLASVENYSLLIHCRKRSTEPIAAAFQKNFFSGTQAALEITGTHGRPNVKVESAPAATTPLSAASRCASHPPSNPTVLPPELGTQPAMAGFSHV